MSRVNRLSTRSMDPVTLGLNTMHLRNWSEIDVCVESVPRKPRIRGSDLDCPTGKAVYCLRQICFRLRLCWVPATVIKVLNLLMFQQIELKRNGKDLVL